MSFYITFSVMYTHTHTQPYIKLSEMYGYTHTHTQAYKPYNKFRVINTFKFGS